MATTTIRIEESLKERIAVAAERLGKSPHAFILEALSDTVERIELDEELERLADERWGALVQTGESVSWSDTKTYLRARVKGEKTLRPSVRKLVR